MHPLHIAVFASIPALQTDAQILAERLHLPYTTDRDAYDYVLILTPKYLGLHKTGEKSLPVHVDFLSGKLTYRRQHASLRHEALARALGLTHRDTPRIIDATAGLARDSFILASLGFEVHLLERSPLIYALVEEGIRRASQNKHVAPIVNRLHLIQTDAITWLNQCTEPPDLIYLDPMFAERQKTALVKKEMRLFHDIVGDDLDAETLLKTALSCATRRVVVKRSRLATPIPGPAPHFNLQGSSSRFDVYLTQEPHGNLTPNS